MTYIAAFDIGTTTIKGLLINSEFIITGEMSVPLNTIHGLNGEMEQNPEEWWHGVKQIAMHWWNNVGIRADEIKMVSFSGQMEDVIPILYTNVHTNAILYSDTRAKGEAEMVNEQFTESRDVIGNSISASTPLAKILWLKREESLSNIKCFLFSSKDYIIYKLTGEFVSDPTTCATTGMMDIRRKAWHEEILSKFQIPLEILPSIKYPDQIASNVTQQAADEIGFLKGTPVLCGSGDAGATTLGAAAVREGDSYLYLGTTGWAAAVTEGPEIHNKGIFNLAHLPRDKYISIAPLLNVGNVHQWAVQTFVEDTKSDPYLGFEEMVNSSEPGSNGLLFLPYLHGERCYIQDGEARGSFWGINPGTKRNDFARSVLEGLCFSLRQTLDVLLKNKAGAVTLIGGGTKSPAWGQCMADILGRAIRIPIDSEYLPAIGATSAAFINLKWSDCYEDFVDTHLRGIKTKEYQPNYDSRSLYQGLYEKFLRLYPSLKNVYLGS